MGRRASRPLIRGGPVLPTPFPIREIHLIRVYPRYKQRHGSPTNKHIQHPAQVVIGFLGPSHVEQRPDEDRQLGHVPSGDLRQLAGLPIPPHRYDGVTGGAGGPLANRLARFLEPWRRAATERAGRDDERSRSQVGALIRRTNRKRQRPFPTASWCADDDQGSFRRAQRLPYGRLSPPGAKRRRSCSTRERRARAVQRRRQRRLRQRCVLPAATSVTRDGARRRHRQRRERSPSRRLQGTHAAASDIRPPRSAARRSPTKPARSSSRLRPKSPLRPAGARRSNNQAAPINASNSQTTAAGASRLPPTTCRR